MGFDRLPSELITHIATLAHPSSHLDFALTCKLHYECCRPVLEHHKECYHNYSSKHCRPINGIYPLSDWEPFTLPQILRKVANDEIAAYHINHLNLYQHRRNWKQWVTYGSKSSGDLDADMSEADKPQKSLYTERELRNYRTIIIEQFYRTESEADEWITRMRNGDDKPMKVLIIGLCSRLKNLIFWCRDLGRANQSHGLHLLKDTIRRIHETQNAIWPPGFLSLKTVVVGQKDDFREGYCRARLRTQPSDVAPFFLLPSIEKLDFEDLEDLSDEENGAAIDYDFDLPQRHSSVRHLRIRRARCEAKLIMPLIRCTRGVHSIDFDDSDLGTLENTYEIFAILAERDEEFGPVIEDIGMEICPSRLLGRFPKLRRFMVGYWDMAHSACMESSGKRIPYIQTMSRVGESFCSYLNSVIPPTTKIFSLSGHGGPTISKEDADLIDDALIQLMKSGRCPNLGRIGLEFSGQWNTTGPWLRKTAQWGRELGIRVRTPWENESRVFWEGKWQDLANAPQVKL